TPVAELNPDVPAELVAVVERLLKKTPDQRFHNTTEVVEALRPLAVVSRVSGKLPARPTNRPAAPAAPNGVPSLLDKGPGPSLVSLPESPLSRSVAPSTPTPRPAGGLNLPSRNSLR